MPPRPLGIEDGGEGGSLSGPPLAGHLWQPMRARGLVDTGWLGQVRVYPGGLDGYIFSNLVNLVNLLTTSIVRVVRVPVTRGTIRNLCLLYKAASTRMEIVHIHTISGNAPAVRGE